MRDITHFNQKVTAETRALRRRMGANIHAARARRGWSLDKAASHAGMSVEAVDRIELGKGDMDLREIIRLCLAMGVGVEWLTV